MLDSFLNPMYPIASHTIAESQIKISRNDGCFKTILKAYSILKTVHKNQHYKIKQITYKCIQ